MFSRSFLYSCRLSGLPICKNAFETGKQAAGLKMVYPPTKYESEPPPDVRGKKLPVYPKVPLYTTFLKPFKMQKKLKLMRGPELVLNKLKHKQYGVIALMGGRLKHGHFEMMRYTCLKTLPRKAFSLYRIDPAWQPVTRKSLGQRMGSGKGPIDHYVTPIKAGRVILEVGGPVEYEEVRRTLEQIAHKLPFKAMAVNQEILDEMKEKEKYIEENNANPYTMKYIIQNNLGGCHNWISPVDKIWFGKHR